MVDVAEGLIGLSLGDAFEGFGGMLTLWRVDPPKVFDGTNWVTPPECE